MVFRGRYSCVSPRLSAKTKLEGRNEEEDIHLHISNRNLRTGRSRRYIITRCDQSCDDERNGCEEAEDVLGAGECGVHRGYWSSLGAS